MKKILPLFASALWWGSLTALGAWVVPMLFKHASSTPEAGLLAARLFEVQTHVSAVCAVVLLMSTRANAVFKDLLWLVSGLLTALVQQWAVAPRIEARDHLALWHTVGSALLLAQWDCAGVILWRQAQALNTNPVSPDPAS